MKSISLIGSDARAVWCGLAPIPKEIRDRCVRDLEKHGYFKFTEARNLQRVLTAAISSGDVFLEESHRAVFVDCEDVFERGGAVMLESCRSALSIRGIHYRRIEDEDSPEEHYLRVDQSKIGLWSFAELRDDVERWCLAGGRATQMVKWLLDESGNNEIALIECTGNDSILVIMERIHCEILEAAGALIPRPL